MKRSANIVKVMVFSILSLVAAIFLWPYAVAGVVAFLVSGKRFNRWISPVFALLVAVGWRLALGEWPLRICGGSSATWHMEALQGIVNWALAAIFVSAFAHWPAKLVEGYRSAATKPA